jgi:4-hydroxy-tetrahydrodipicolinate synthase
MARVMDRLPQGTYPVMLTAFGDGGAIDWDGVDRLTDFYLASGASGLFAAAMSGEAHVLDDDEKVALVQRVAERTAGRVPVVAGALGSGDIEEQAALVRRVSDAGASQAVVTVCQLAAESEDDDVWTARAEELLGRLSGDIALGIYECPRPYWRHMSDTTFRWAVDTGRFGFFKDTCCDIATIRRRLEIARGSSLQLFNAHTMTLLESLQAGAEGFSGIAANFCPELYVWFCGHHAESPDLACELQQAFSRWYPSQDAQYPKSAKAFLQLRGIKLRDATRLDVDDLTAETRSGLDVLHTEMTEWIERILAA